MIKFRHNKILLFFLVAAFFTVQCTEMHIHLAGHHVHDGNHYQHNIQAHAHYASSHHADTIDSTYGIDDYNVVELDNDCTSPRWKKTGNQLTVSISIPYQLLFAPKFSSIQLPEQNSNKHSYITYSTIRLRAPPQFS